MKDILTHVIVAVFLNGIAAILSIEFGEPGIILLAIVANTVGWPLREAVQRATRGNDPWAFTPHTRWEAYPPVAVGWLIGGVALWFG